MVSLVGRVGGYLWNYVSPRKDQGNRVAALKHSRGDDRPASGNAARGGRWTGGKAGIEDGSAEFDGDTLVGDDRLPSDDFEANESTLVMNEYDYANGQLEQKDYFDVEAERERLEKVAEELREQGWAEDAITLFLRLEARGKDPILPISWELEFTTLPAGLFNVDSKAAYLGSLSDGGGFRASIAFKDLLELAGRVRDAFVATNRNPTQCPRAPETIAKKAVAKFLKWAYADAKLKVTSPKSRKSLDNTLLAGKMLPIIINEAGPRSMPGAELQASALEKLIKLGEHWKAALYDKGTDSYTTELPTLYAVISTSTVMGFVAYDIDFVNDDGEIEEPFLRTIVIFDFNQKGYDVWNSIAIAILGVHVRNEMVDLKNDMRNVLGEEQESGADDDDVDL